MCFRIAGQVRTALKNLYHYLTILTRAFILKKEHKKTPPKIDEATQHKRKMVWRLFPLVLSLTVYSVLDFCGFYNHFG